MLFYDGDGDCGSGAGLDPNLRWCLNAPLAFMLNTSAIWEGVGRLTFFITYSNDVDARRACMFCGDEGAALWGTYVSTWVAAMRHPHYMKVAAPQIRNPYLQFLTLSAAGWWPPRVPNPHPRCLFTAMWRQQLSVRPSAGRPQVAIHTAPAFVSHGGCICFTRRLHLFHRTHSLVLPPQDCRTGCGSRPRRHWRWLAKPQRAQLPPLASSSPSGIHEIRAVRRRMSRLQHRRRRCCRRPCLHGRV